MSAGPQLDPGYIEAVLAEAERGAPAEHHAIELIDWATIHDHGDELVEGLLIPGRWTALNAGPKAGKSTLAIFVTVELSEGRDPYDGAKRDPVVVLYIDAEMGRLDLEERLAAMGHHEPGRLTRWHATDMPPRLDTEPGGNALLAEAKHLGVEVVVIDGINGTVTGGENDDTTWRAFFEHTIAKLKRAGVAVLTSDNLGKDEARGPRGSSVKLDKPDAVISLRRVDNGVKLVTTHRRTSAYPAEQSLLLCGLDGSQPLTYRRTGHAWPDGTERIASVLDQLGVPLDLGRRKAREALTAAGHKVSSDVLRGAINWRRKNAEQITFNPFFEDTP